MLNFKNAYLESLTGNRKGDKPEETEKIVELLKKGTLGIATNNYKKFLIAKKVAQSFGIKNVQQITIPTNCFDLTPIPALSKATAGSFISDCDFLLARGRLGAPGSGALTVLIHKSGAIVSAVTSPPSHIHKLPLEQSLIADLTTLFRRLGMERKGKGITPKTETIYSSLTFLDLVRKIAEKKAKPLKTFKGNSLLIIGGYLWGAFLPKLLKDNFQEIYIYDINHDVLQLCSAISKVKHPKTNHFDLIIDLTGYGGVKVEKGKAGKFTAKITVSEEPSADRKLKTEKSPHYLLKLKNRNFNTSGTMTLTIKISRNAAERAEKELPILYAVPQLSFFESLLFEFSSPDSFLNALNNPILSVSAPKGEVKSEDLDEIIEKEVKNLEFTLERV
jgi:hypothetical protein